MHGKQCNDKAVGHRGRIDDLVICRRTTVNDSSEYMVPPGQIWAMTMNAVGGIYCPDL